MRPEWDLDGSELGAERDLNGVRVHRNLREFLRIPENTGEIQKIPEDSRGKGVFVSCDFLFRLNATHIEHAKKLKS